MSDCNKAVVIHTAMKIVETQNIERIQNLADKCYMKAYEKIHTVEQNRFSFHEMYSAESLREQLVHGQFFVITDEGQDKGYISIYPISANQWMLDKLYILPECKGLGYGRKLVEYVIGTIRNQSQAPFEIVLNVNRRNDSVAFYQHMGFEISSSWDREIADGRWLMDGFKMRRKFEA